MHSLGIGVSMIVYFSLINLQFKRKMTSIKCGKCYARGIRKYIVVYKGL